jgi:hypothetical protein
LFGAIGLPEALVKVSTRFQRTTASEASNVSAERSEESLFSASVVSITLYERSELYSHSTEYISQRSHYYLPAFSHLLMPDEQSHYSFSDIIFSFHRSPLFPTGPH